MNKIERLRQMKLKLLMCVSEIDGHDRGPRYVTHSLRDAGIEVIYIRYKIIEQVVGAAMQEDVDIIGISSYTGGHITTIADLMKLLKARGLDHILVLLGGIIPNADRRILKERGVGEIFGPGTSIDNITDYIFHFFQKQGGEALSSLSKT